MKEGRKISNSISRRMTPQVVDLLFKGITPEIISEELGISTPLIKQIAKAHNIIIVKRKKIELIEEPELTFKETFALRNIKILEELKSGGNYVTVGKKYNLSKQRVREISIANGYDKMKNQRAIYYEIVKQIIDDINLGLNYYELKKKYSLSIKVIGTLRNYGLPSLFTEINTTRKKIIVDEYKTKIAREVVESTTHGINNPNQLSSVNNVYTISSKMGYKRYPNIGKRCNGGMQEKIETLELIKHKRDVEKMKFKNIVNFLNDNEIKTIGGKSFTLANVTVKYTTFTKGLKPKNKVKNAIEIPTYLPVNKKIILKLRY